MRMMKKPEKPIRRNKEIVHDIDDGDSLQFILSFIEDEVPLEDVRFVIDGSCKIYYSKEETYEEFQVRLKQYEQKLAKYMAWYNKNKEEIDRFLKIKREDSIEKAERYRDSEIRKLEKMLAKLKAQKDKESKSKIVLGGGDGLIREIPKEEQL